MARRDGGDEIRNTKLSISKIFGLTQQPLTDEGEEVKSIEEWQREWKERDGYLNTPGQVDEGEK